MSSIRFLVTGASGFVGVALCNELELRGLNFHSVVRNAEEGKNNCYGVGELDGRTVWASALNGVNVIIHLAARVDVVSDSAEDPIVEFRRVNVEATLNLARQAVQAGVQRFVYVSTVKVNGESSAEGHAFSEASVPDPSGVYATSKWEAEQALMQLGRDTNLEVVIVRPPLIYGPRVRGNFLSLIDIVNSGCPLPLKSTHNKRSLLFVGNLVDALILCATHPNAAGQSYFVDDGGAVSSAELVAVIAGNLGVRDPCFSFPTAFLRVLAALFGRRAAVGRLTQSLVVSSCKLRSELGWCPVYSLDAGLRITVDWYLRCFDEPEKLRML